MAVIYISESGNAEYLTENQSIGAIHGDIEDSKAPKRRTAIRRILEGKRAEKEGKPPEEQDRIERELQEELAKYHQIGTKKVEPGGRFVMMSRAVLYDQGWDESAMLDQVKSLISGKSFDRSNSGCTWTLWRSRC